MRYLKHTTDFGLFYPKACEFELLSYSDADFAGCKTDRKSTSGTCHFLGQSLVSWCCKKQNSVSLSITEAEYIAVGLACAQVLWMQQMLSDYGITLTKSPILCDNNSAICISKNPALHSRTKHIDVRHHFIRDHIDKGHVTVDYCPTGHQIADIFTKPLKEDDYVKFRRELGICTLDDLL